MKFRKKNSCRQDYEVINSYEEKIRTLKDEYQTKLDEKNERIQEYKEEISHLREVTRNLSNRNFIINNNANSMSNSESSKDTKYDQREANIGVNVDQAQDGSKVTGVGIQNNYSPEQKQSLPEAAAEIQQLLIQLQRTCNTEDAQQQVAKDLVNKARSNTSFRSNLIKWGQSLGDTAAQTTVSEAVKGVIKLVLVML
jgi:chromosome segregation ATPase